MANTDGRTVDDDTYHEILSKKRRREVIDLLDEYGSLDKSELVTLVASRELGKPTDELESKDRNKFMTSISQQHLKKLIESDAVRMDNNIVEQGPAFDVFVSGLDRESEQVNITLHNAEVVIEGATVHIRGMTNN